WRGQRQEAPGYRPARVPPPRGRLPGPLSSGGRDDPGVACPQPARSLPLKDQQVSSWETPLKLQGYVPSVPWFPTIAVGTTIADRPPHRSVRAELPHTAPTLDVLRQIARQDMDAGYGVEESTVRRSVADGPIPVAAADYDGAKPAATACTDDPGIAATPRCYPAQRDSGNNLPRPVSATRPRRSPAHASSGAPPASTTAASPSSASPRFDALRQSDLSGSSHSSG